MSSTKARRLPGNGRRARPIDWINRVAAGVALSTAAETGLAKITRASGIVKYFGFEVFRINPEQPLWESV
jgi:hypothetical protein